MRFFEPQSQPAAAGFDRPGKDRKLDSLQICDSAAARIRLHRGNSQ
jgi:hypothetical protein